MNEANGRPPSPGAFAPELRGTVAPAGATGIRVEGIVRRFGRQTVLDRVGFTIEGGTIGALLGPSGSGKTTLLRIIAGLDRPDAGDVHIGGAKANDTAVQDRNIGFVFQNYALFKHMTVRKNVAFALEVRRTPKAEVDARVEELLRLVQLEKFGDRYPSQLSGGQKQRVALARALAPRPRVLLLDEPLGALDRKVREELRDWLRRLHDEVHVTSLFVTHDQEEAMQIADRVVLMNQGRVEQIGSPAEVYERPATAFVASFLGRVNVFRGEAKGGVAEVAGTTHMFPDHADGAARPVTAYIRPHDLDVHLTPPSASAMRARITRVQATGATVRVSVVLAGSGDMVDVEVARERFVDLALELGMDVYVSPRQVRLFLDDNAP